METNGSTQLMLLPKKRSPLLPLKVLERVLPRKKLLLKKKVLPKKKLPPRKQLLDYNEKFNNKKCRYHKCFYVSLFVAV